MYGLTRLAKHMKLYREGRGHSFCKPVRVSIISDSKPHRRWIKDDHCYAVLMNQILKPSGKFSSVLFVIKAARRSRQLLFVNCELFLLIPCLTLKERNITEGTDLNFE